MFPLCLGAFLLSTLVLWSHYKIMQGIPEQKHQDTTTEDLVTEMTPPPMTSGCVIYTVWIC